MRIKSFSQNEITRIAREYRGHAYLDKLLMAIIGATNADAACIAKIADTGSISLIISNGDSGNNHVLEDSTLSSEYLEGLKGYRSHCAKPVLLESVLDAKGKLIDNAIYLLAFLIEQDEHNYLIILTGNNIRLLSSEEIDLIHDQYPRISIEVENIILKNKLTRQKDELDFVKSNSKCLFWSMNLNGNYTDVSSQSLNIYGYEPETMLGKHYSEFMSGQSTVDFKSNLDVVTKEKGVRDIMATHTDINNDLVHIISNVSARYDNTGKVVGYIGTTADVTGSVNAERTIKNNSELFSSILARLPVIFFRIDENGIIADIRGDGLVRMGVEDLDWVGKPGYGLFLGMDKMIDSALSGEAVHFRSKGSYQGKPWWFYTSMFFDSWTGFGAVGFSVDITDQVEGEEKLVQLLNDNRILAQRLVEVQEDERRNLARELHDELGQSITAVKSLAKAITATTGDTYSEVRSLGNSIIDLSGRLYDVVNNIMQRLRPDVMDSSIGFESTIRSCVTRSQLEKTGVNVDVKIHGNINDLDEVVKITVYRIIQEALTNISKYAMASNVEILLRRKKGIRNSRLAPSMQFHPDCMQLITNLKASDILILQISDDGVGMDINKHSRSTLRKQKMGLQGIKERVTALRGELILDSAKGKGMTLCTILDLKTRNGNGSGKSHQAGEHLSQGGQLGQVVGE